LDFHDFHFTDESNALHGLFILVSKWFTLLTQFVIARTIEINKIIVIGRGRGAAPSSF